MQQYFTIEGTPLKYHKFLHYFSMPVNFISSIVSIAIAVLEMDAYNWGYTVDFCYSFLMLVLSALCFIGFFKWKPYAWYSVILIQLATVPYRLIIVVISIVYSTGTLASDLGTLIGTTIVNVLICIYYYKRKPLFFLTEQPAQQPVFTVPAAPAPTASALPARFCGNCGSKLLPDSVFCSECGTKV